MQAKDQFAELAVDAVLRLKGGTNLEAIHVLKKPGGNLEARRAFGGAARSSRPLCTGKRPCVFDDFARRQDECPLAAQESFLDEGFILDKKIGVGQPKRLENANILVANTAMDTDKIKIYGARVRVDSMQKVLQLRTAWCKSSSVGAYSE